MINKIALIGDLHFGVRGNSQSFLKYQLDYFNEDVFPELEKRKIKNIIQLGDVWNSRKIININTYHWVKKRFLEPLKKMGIKLYVILGNHDSYYTYSTEITSLSILKEYDNIVVIDKPTLCNIEGLKCSLVPWMSNEEDIKSFKIFCNKNPHDITFGHFEINNFEVIKGHFHEGGINKKFFENFEKVYSGHFHLRQEQDNIHYLGTPYELTWGDYDSTKGWYVLDTKTKQLESIINTKYIHKKIYYDEDFINDAISDIDDITGKNIKLFVVNKRNEKMFADFLYSLEQKNPNNFLIIDNFDNNENIQLTDEGKSTFDIIKDYLKDIEENDTQIEKILGRLYNETLIEGNI